MNLLDQTYISLATYRKSGAEVRTPIWFASESDAVHYCFSAGDAGKVKRIRNSPASSIAPCDMRGGLTGEWIPCQAFLVNDRDEIEKTYRLLVQKYGWQMRLTNFFSRLSGRINQRAVIRLEI